MHQMFTPHTLKTISIRPHAKHARNISSETLRIVGDPWHASTASNNEAKQNNYTRSSFNFFNLPL
jgi:hypothetical protein